MIEWFIKEALANAIKPSEENKKRSDTDFALWKDWHESGRPEDKLHPLLNRYRGLVNDHVNRFSGQMNISEPVLRAEFMEHLLNGIKTYDPTRGTQLNTHVSWQLKKGGRFIRRYQNVGRITEHRVLQIAKFNNTFQRLEDDLGRTPSTEEMADEMKWSPAEVDRMMSERKKDLVSSGFLEDPFIKITPRERKIVRQLHYDLTPEEKSVWEYIFGMNGKKQTDDVKFIAEKLNYSTQKVYRLRQSLTRKFEEYL